jgi:hypothetical protein
VCVGPSASDQDVKRATFSTTAGDTPVVAVDSNGKPIRVLSFYLLVDSAATAVTITFEDLTGTTHTAVGPLGKPTAGVPYPGNWNPHGHFETLGTGALNLHQSGTSQITGWITYQLVDATNDP